jgi:hypothetical protein
MPYEVIAPVLAVVRNLQVYMIRFKAELNAFFTGSLLPRRVETLRLERIGGIRTEIPFTYL